MFLKAGTTAGWFFENSMSEYCVLHGRIVTIKSFSSAISERTDTSLVLRNEPAASALRLTFRF